MMAGRRLLDYINSAALLVLGAVTFVAIGPSLDQFFPVAKPFVVEQQKMLDGQIQISGWLEKRRNCRFVEVVGLAHRTKALDLVVPVDFTETPTGKPLSRPTGVQSWGPWHLSAPAGTTSVDLISYHRCHPLWETKTLLATVEVTS